MDNKTKEELGFSMIEIDDNTILIEGVVQKKASKKSKAKKKRQFSKINLHLFDREYIEKLQEIEFEIVLNEIDSIGSFKERINQLARKLME